MLHLTKSYRFLFQWFFNYICLILNSIPSSFKRKKYKHIMRSQWDYICQLHINVNLCCYYYWHCCPFPSEHTCTLFFETKWPRGPFHSLWSHVLGSLCADRLSQTSTCPFWLLESSAMGQMGTVYANIPFVRFCKDFIWKTLWWHRTFLFILFHLSLEILGDIIKSRETFLFILLIPGNPGRH